MNAPLSRRVPDRRGRFDPLEALMSLLSPAHARQLREVANVSFRMRFERANGRRPERSDQKLLDDYIPDPRDAFYKRPWIGAFRISRATR